MSFGRRLILFFILIVVLPMLAVGALLLQVTAESKTGKADARLSAGVETAIAIADEQSAAAQVKGRQMARDPGLARALLAGRPLAAQRVAAHLAATPGVTGVSIVSPDGASLARAGDPQAVLPGNIALQDPTTQASLGTLEVSTTSAATYGERVAQLTGRQTAVIADGRYLGGTAAIDPSEAPAAGETADLSLEGSEHRARSVDLQGGDQLVLIGPREGGGPTINVGVALLLALLFAAAVAFATFLARTLHTLHELTSRQAATDELTGLSNPRRFREILDKEIGRATRFGHGLSLLMLDLDDFKSVNDTHGHLQGDDVLREVATAVKDVVREVDEPARYGGEEFAVALPETGLKGATEVAERIRSRVESLEVPLRSGGKPMKVTVSIGVGVMGGKIEDADGLIAAADEALYAAKRAGKNRVEVSGKPKPAPRRRRTDRKKPAARKKSPKKG